LPSGGDLHVASTRRCSVFEFVSLSFVGVVALLSLVTICSESLRRFLDIQITSWTLRRQGVDAKEIHKLALIAAKRQRQNPVVQILMLLLDFIKSMKK
jgi:hypothetical protein